MSPEDSPVPPDWRPVAAPLSVFRFLTEPDPAADGFAANFSSDGEREKKLVEGEHPDILSGMSVFVSEAAARKRWAEIRSDALRRRSERNKRRKRPFRMGIGDHIAEVELTPGQGFEIAGTPDAEGHLTIRGDKDRLAAKVAAIYPAASNPT